MHYSDIWKLVFSRKDACRFCVKSYIENTSKTYSFGSKVNYLTCMKSPFLSFGVGERRHTVKKLSYLYCNAWEGNNLKLN